MQSPAYFLATLFYLLISSLVFRKISTSAFANSSGLAVLPLEESVNGGVYFSLSARICGSKII
jgi:hypothetical protein